MMIMIMMMVMMLMVMIMAIDLKILLAQNIFCTKRDKICKPRVFQNDRREMECFTVCIHNRFADNFAKYIARVMLMIAMIRIM